jgi:NAD(P)-dependent dehydrogenase (short-subunit alcohol dehydrogenase family)
MSVVVITGSTRGIGYGMAQEFLKRGWSVVINGRSQSSVDDAIKTLGNDPKKIGGAAADMSNYEQVQALWDAAVKQFGKVDYWVNNAGIDIESANFWELPPDEYRKILEINLLGVMNASHVALNGMMKQGSGQLFNMEGFGSDGRKGLGMASYGSTKYALRYFTQSLAMEVAKTPVKVSTISPGMVITDLLVGKYDKSSAEWARVKRIFNILADKVETVSVFLVEGMIANQKNNAAIAWLTTPKIAWRFMTASFIKRDVFGED